MSNRIMLQLCAFATFTALFTSVGMRADTLVLTQGTPAPSLSPILNHDVNFDNVATGTMITPALFAAQGIASITNAGDPLFTFGGTQSLPNYVGTGGADGFAADITIMFNTLQNEVGFGDAGPNTVTFSAFGPKGALLFTDTFSSTPNNAYWVLTDDTAANIASIEIKSSFIAIDDVQFNNLTTTTTPEPSSLLLLGTGVFGIASTIWRKRRVGRVAEI
jgi:hypothetical protein